MLVFLSLYFWGIYHRFLVCGYREVHVYQPVHCIAVYVKLMVG